MSIFQKFKEILSGNTKSNFSFLDSGYISTQTSSIDSELIYFSGSKLCPLCSVYNRRIFSKSGKDKRFPPFSMLPKNLQSVNCPECGVFLGFSAYHALNIDGELIRDIKESNRPFVDIRTAEQKKLYEEEKQKKLLKIQNKVEYTWICENLPDLAPKSLSGYSRMKNSNSANYRKIRSLMKEKGFELNE